jgi:quercetin dioxygenase-like cupin family protein
MFLRSYTGSDGQSHGQVYEDVPNGLVSLDTSEDITIISIPSGSARDFHNTPNKKFMITLSGEAEVEYGDGKKQRLKAGDIHYEEDVSGQGHKFKVVGDKPRVTLVIPIK